MGAGRLRAACRDRPVTGPAWRTFARVEASVEAGVRYLTLYAFSTENWNRPAEEVRGLLGLIDLYLERELNALDRNGVRLRHLGSLEGLAPGTRRRVERAMQRTATTPACTEYRLQLRWPGGNRAGARRLVRSNLTPDQVTEAAVAACLDTSVSLISTW